MKINPSTVITSVTMINMDNDIESELFEITGSKCHFNKEFEYKDYLIQLRLDWNDIVNGDPVMDADIWRKPKCRKNRLRNGRWHHSEKKFDSASGRNIYMFEFENFKLRLGTKASVAKILRCDLRVIKPTQLRPENL